MRTSLLSFLISVIVLLPGCRERAEEPPQTKAFCIDFNWGPKGVNAFSGPGYWAKADPEEHVRWYKDLGCNVIQTFAVSCNGYAWYKNGVVPEQPGLAHDFLTEMVQLGHQNGMMVFGYFCVGANTKWGQDHPDLSYGIPSAPHIPFTRTYLDYLSASIQDALKKTKMDGFMIDWVWNPDGPLRWMDCEKQMYQELMDEPFPGTGALTPDQELSFRRKSIDRCWRSIREAAKGTDPNCIIWLSCNQLTHPDIAGSSLLKDVDWIMNEAPDSGQLDSLKEHFGPHARRLQCMVGWPGHNPKKILTSPQASSIDIYGFAAPLANSLPLPVSEYLSKPIDSFTGNDRNIAVFARYFNHIKVEELKIDPPGFSLARIPSGDSVQISLLPTSTIEGVGIHYTVDGSAPTVNSPGCQQTMRFAIPLAFKAEASYNGNMMGGTVGFSITKAFGRTVTLQYEPGKKYPGNGAATLTDGILGNTSYSSGTWLGFEGDDCDAMIDLGELQTIRKISLEYLVNPSAWIFEPLETRFEVSQNGLRFTTVGAVRHEANDWDNVIRVGSDAQEFPALKARYVNIVARNRGVCPTDHPGKGEKAWVFVDEISIQ
jgi:hypothetical protein